MPGYNMPYLNMIFREFPDAEIIHLGGKNSAVGTTFVPVVDGGLFQMPKLTGATTLRIKAGGHVNDTAAGSGAREVTVVVLNQLGVQVTEVIATAGADASAVTTVTAMRLLDAFVSKDGAYPTTLVGSHDADIVIENGSGGTDWATIPVADYPNSKAGIGFYTVPLGKKAAILNFEISVDTTKLTDVVFICRENILEVAAPYSPMWVLETYYGLIRSASFEHVAPHGPFPALTDLGYLAKVSASTAEVDIDFELVLFDE